VNDRLYRSVDDRVLAGVCGGLADRLGIDPALVRIAWVLLALVSNGVFVLIYIVMAIVVPEEDDVAVFPPGSVPPPGQPGAPGAPAGLAGSDAASVAPGMAAGIAAGEAGAAGSPGPVQPGTSYWVPPTSQAQWRAQARAERRAARAARRAQRPGQASLVLGIILILLGGWFLLEQYVPEFDAGRFWPFIVIALGVVLLAFAFGGWPGGKREQKP
jgi:phage shock protein PspC (stress-responsive transcriptional regulator)